MAGTLFSLSASLRPERSSPHCVCVVSKKIAPKAVDRNRIKRRCREATRMHARGIAKPLLLVFRARREAASATFAEVERDVHSLIEKFLEKGYNDILQ